MNPIKKTFLFGNKQVHLETGRMARQADASVLVTIDEICVLVTVTAAKKMKESQDFFPLSVHYQERAYSAGKIPGGFIKREGRVSEKETLTSRLIDRPIRPLFPKDFMNEVQVICMVLSTDKKNDPDVAAMIGTSAALALSGIPFLGPFAAARIGFDAEEGYLLNPSYEQLKNSSLDMMVAGTQNAILMVESEAKELTEDEMLGAVLFAQQEYQCVINAIQSLAQEAAKPAWVTSPGPDNSALIEAIKTAYSQKISEAYQIPEKPHRNTALTALRDEVVKTLSNDVYQDDQILKALSSLEKALVRNHILDTKTRIDGRNLETVRPIYVDVDVLPATHGSALFTRGETQALAVVTLGSVRDAQQVDCLEGEKREPFMLHYNFPPFSVGECGRLGPPGRREVGHGRLARRGIQAVLPSEESFPYTIRVVSEITESNGSSSMASVCGSSLALMDAGVPLKAPVAGIAMGLIKEENRYAVLTDILGDEDHLGDMDFKVAGTVQGITALQMDIKITGITEEIMENALMQAHQARLHILKEMNQVLSETRQQVSENAPRTLSIQINPEKIREVIGKGGSTIRAICEETGATVDISDSGLVKIYADSQEACQAAEDKVTAITSDIEIGTRYAGQVVRIADFGAFVSILPGQDGLVHISQISDERVNSVEDYLSVGQTVQVIVIDVDMKGRIKLSMKPSLIEKTMDN